MDTLPVEQKLAINIVEGTKENLIPHLDESLTRWSPLDVVNIPLLAAMGRVGELFKNNELIVAEVLQSAEVMKAAVSYLEQFMEPEESNVKGTVLLATVKGDVHDIGKNLVEIILGNNGYKVINLGIKCPPQDLIDAYHKYKPDFIGLSGLLVKSAEQMVVTVKDFKEAGIHVPVLVGGAALTENFTVKKIAIEYDYPVIYCRDAMSGLEILNNLSLDPVKRAQWIHEYKTKADTIQKTPKVVIEAPEKEESLKKLYVDHSSISIAPPHTREVIFEYNIEDVWQYINPIMLYNKHLGFKGNMEKLYKEGDPKAVKLMNKVDEIKQNIINQRMIKPKGIYRFFPAKSFGNSIKLYNDHEKEMMSFTFPRQSKGEQICLADFINDQKMDSLAAFVVTCGEGIAELVRNLMNKGQFLEAHTVTALSIESAEALAEYIHKEIRQLWGLQDDPNLSLQDIFKAKYTGVRVSFGYPACPRIEDQTKLWKLLQPEKIGVTLSDNYMMYPDASVSAVVFHHPQAKYFNINEEDLALFEEMQQV